MFNNQLSEKDKEEEGGEVEKKTRQQQSLFVVFASFHCVNTPIRPEFKLPTFHNWTQSYKKKMCTIGSQEQS